MPDTFTLVQENPLLYLLFAPSVFLMVFNGWIHYGYTKKWHAASAIHLVGGLLAFCVAASLFKQWWAVFFFLFDYVWVTMFMLWGGWISRPEETGNPGTKTLTLKDLDD